MKLKIVFLIVLSLFVLSVITDGQAKESDNKDAFGWKESILGVCVIGMAIYIVKQETEHRKERKSWQDLIIKQFDDVKEVAEKKAVLDAAHISVLSRIETLLMGERSNRRRGTQ